MIKNILKKSAIATAVSLVISAPVLAVDYDVSLGTDTVVLVEEIFGINPAESNGQSDLTLVQMPNIDVDLDVTSAIGAALGDGDVFDDGGTSTVQLILGGDAQWGEDLSTTQLMACANGGAGAISGNVYNVTDGAAGVLVPATSCAGAAVGTAEGQIFYEVTQGGAPTDNTVTLRFTSDSNTPGDALSLDDFTFQGVKVKNLTNQLSSASAHAVMFSSEYNEEVESGVGLFADDTDASENDAPVKIFGSKSSITLTATPLAAGSIRRIAVASDQKMFTNNIPGITDFTAADDVNYVGIGSVQADITVITAADIDASGPQAVVTTDIKGEDGLDFEYAGGDTHSMTLDGGNFNAYAGVGGGIFLDDVDATVADKCNVGGSGAMNAPTAVLSGGATATVTATNDGTGTAVFALQGNTVALTTEYDICFDADGTTDIDEEAQQMDITYTVDYFNARYDNVNATAGTYGPIQRNGCIASFFNIPASTNTDVAYVRLTNTSDASTGGVSGHIFAQDGTDLVTAGFDLMAGAELAPHETAVFWSGEGDLTTGQGRTIYSIPDAAGIAAGQSVVDYVGRGRLVASGAFPVCEALGLLRTGDGSLFNMTATTQGNHAKSPTDRGNNGN